MLVHDRPHVDNLYSDPKYSPVPTGFVTDLYPEDPPAHASSGVEAMDNNQYPGYHNTGADPASTVTNWSTNNDYNHMLPRSGERYPYGHLSSYAHASRISASKTLGHPIENRLEQPRSHDNRQSKRQSLLPAYSFGFDVQNGSPKGSKILGNTIFDYPLHNEMPCYDRTKRSEGVELITVPALGAEYTGDEIKAMKKNRRFSKQVTKNRNIRDAVCKLWKSESKATCRNAIIFAFAFFVCTGMLLYFVIPRVPVFALQTVKPLEAVPDGSSMLTHHIPTNFSMNMNVNLRADNTGSWIRTVASKIELNVWDLTTHKLVGTGYLPHHTFPARRMEAFQVPVRFAYASLNATGDATWTHWIKACGPKYANTPRESLNLNFILSMTIEGLVGTRGTSTSLSNIQCPFTLQGDQT